MPSKTPAARVRTRRGPRAATILAAAGVALVAGAASMAGAQVSITPLPRLQGLGFYGSISDDGRIVSGFEQAIEGPLNGQVIGAYWTADTGLSVSPDPTIRLSRETLFTSFRGQTHFTSDGQYALGHRTIPGAPGSQPRLQPVKVRLADWSVIELPGIPDMAVGMSSDGRTIAGSQPGSLSVWPLFQQESTSWVWREGQGVTTLPKPMDLNFHSSNMSADGRTVVARSNSTDEFVYQWRDGVRSEIRGTPTLPAVIGTFFSPSRSGQMAVATISNFGIQHTIAILDADGIWELLFPEIVEGIPGRLVPWGITDDGNRAVFTMSPFPGARVDGYIWDRTLGLMRFENFITMLGIDSPAGVQNIRATAMSPDGLHFLATGRTVDGDVHFVISIPAPGVTGSLGLGLIAAAHRRRR